VDVRFFTAEDALRETLQDLPPLRKDSPAPLWVQLKNVLASTLADPAVLPDTKLPSEAALCAIFGVSRPIVRLALDALTSAQLVVKVPRQGAFVAPRKLDADFASLNTGLFGEMAAKGHKVETRILEMLRASPSGCAFAFQLAATSSRSVASIHWTASPPLSPCSFWRATRLKALSGTS
jgi:GntR family transcriptional regulator